MLACFGGRCDGSLPLSPRALGPDVPFSAIGDWNRPKAAAQTGGEARPSYEYPKEKVVVDAVCCEPVWDIQFPAYREITGNFADFGPTNTPILRCYMRLFKGLTLEFPIF
jgi:hypothetical protein